MSWILLWMDLDFKDFSPKSVVNLASMRIVV